MFEAFADAGAVDGVDFAGGLDGAFHVVDDEAGDAVFDDFGDGAAAGGWPRDCLDMFISILKVAVCDMTACE